MTLTPTFLTGWEHGVATLDSALGGGLASSFGGTPTSSTTAARSGTYGLLLNSAGEFIKYVTATTGLRKNAARFYIRFSSALPGAPVDLFSFYNSTTQLAQLFFDTTGTRLKIVASGGTAQSVGPNPPVADTWYRVDIQFDSSGTTWTIRCKIDGGTEATATAGSHVATDLTGWVLGDTGATSFTWHVDDFIYGTYTVDSEYWGDGQVVGLSPNAEGTHNNAANVMEDQAGNDINGTTVTAFDKINSVPIGSGTTRLQSNGAGATNYVEVAFPDLPANASTVNGARAVLSKSSASAAGNAAETRIRRGDGTPADVVEVGSTVTTTNINQPGTIGTGWSFGESASTWYKGAMIPATASGTDFGSLTVAIVNALLARLGYASDATPDPWWIDLMIEVDYVASAAGSLPGSRKTPYLASRDFNPWSWSGWQ